MPARARRCRCRGTARGSDLSNLLTEQPIELRLLLTAADTRDKVCLDELDQALRFATTTLTWQALTAADATLSSLAASGE